MEVLDYHKLKIFKTVADLKSFSKAAELLFLAQPTVTLQIKKIENYLGITLFKRSKNEIELTEEGKIFYQYASKILDDYSIMEAELSKLKEDINKNLSIGTSSTIGNYLLPHLLPKFLELYPFAKIHLFVGNSKEIEEGVLSKSFNIGLVEVEIKSNKINFKPLFEDKIILVASSENPIPSTIKPQDLRNYKIIFREVGSGTRNVVEEELKKFKIDEIEPVIEVSSSTAMARLVKNSKDYLTFVSELVVEEDLKEGKLKEVKVEGLSIKRYFSYITQKNIRFSNIENKFLNFLQNESLQ